MYRVGLDVHDNRTSLEILDCNGKLFKRQEVKGRWSAVMAQVGRIPRPFAVCFEASCGYGYRYEDLARHAAVVKVAHPGKLRLIFGCKRKNNRIDAGKLAKILYLDAVPAVHVPGLDVRSWRQTIEFRQRLLAGRVRTKNRLRALLKENGIEAAKNLWSKKSLKELAKLAMPEESSALRRDLLLAELEESSQKIKRVEAYLKRISDHHPAVALLRTIPGVGPRTAEALVAYIDDVRRFARLKQVGCYFGLVPCQDASGDKNRLGHITRDGPATVRKLLCEATWVAIRKSPGARAFFQRVRRDDPLRKKIALVATAHWLLRCAAAMLRSGECWRERETPAPSNGSTSPGGGGENPSGPKGSPLPRVTTPDGQRFSPPPPLSASPFFPSRRRKRKTEAARHAVSDDRR